MAVKVSIINPVQNRVSIQSEKRGVIRTVNVLPDLGNISSLAGLSDVSISNPANNQTLVYDSNIQKFTNKELPIVNGGDF